jgi:hypothetical protein
MTIPRLRSFSNNAPLSICQHVRLWSGSIPVLPFREVGSNESKETEMKKITSLVLASSLAFGASTAFAGGPVVIEDEPVVEAAAPRSGWIVPVIVGLVIVCAIACGDDDTTTTTTTTLGS